MTAPLPGHRPRPEVPWGGAVTIDPRPALSELPLVEWVFFNRARADPYRRVGGFDRHGSVQIALSSPWLRTDHRNVSDFELYRMAE